MAKIDVAKAQQEVKDKSAQDVLKWALAEFEDKIALASSFGAEDVVLIDMLLKINHSARIFTLDTGRLNPETYDVFDKVRERYDTEIEVYFPDAKAVEEMERRHGPNLFYKSIESRKLCCNARKVEPLGRALKNLDAWITGLRREQAVTRANVQKVEIDEAHGGIIKVNPLVDWTEKQVWDYIKEKNVPYNLLHDKGYPSIGCAPCTRAVKPGEDVRAGRWWWESPEQKECGLHPSKKK